MESRYCSTEMFHHQNAADRTIQRRRLQPPRVNYPAMEASNTHLGRAGELFAMNYERARLIRAGAALLSDATYHLYRIFRFRANPRLFGLKGALDETCRLVASQYSAQVK